MITHLAAGFDGIRQLCARCGVTLVTTIREELGGAAQWPPPWPPGEAVEIELDEFLVIRYAGAFGSSGGADCPIVEEENRA